MLQVSGGTPSADTDGISVMNTDAVRRPEALPPLHHVPGHSLRGRLWRPASRVEPETETRGERRTAGIVSSLGRHRHSVRRNGLIGARQNEYENKNVITSA